MKFFPFTWIVDLLHLTIAQAMKIAKGSEIAKEQHNVKNYRNCVRYFSHIRPSRQ